ncbi:MAG: DJ-1/PfpI family protein [Chlamydiae bacterium]|nr:DJ-1/PfpI family protein [Chlamydiota bacterium]MBI3277619.1 DJ-1/PfpI family protein [Chlamydiota bacterium]
MSKKVLVVLAEGFEEIEAVTPMDVLRRAGLEVIVAGLSGKTVAGSHGIKIQADVTLDEVSEVPDLLILPGGMPGAQNLGSSKKVAEMIKKVDQEKKWLGAICAAPPLAVAPTGILNGKRATCYPGYEDKFPSSVTFLEERVVRDGKVVTSRGPGSALEFSLCLVEQLVGKDKANDLKKDLLVKC